MGISSPRQGFNISAEKINVAPTLSTDLNLYDKPSFNQKTIKRANDSLDHFLFINSLDDRGKAIINSKMAKFANAWTIGTPSSYNGHDFPKVDFQMLLRYHSLVPLSNTVQKCPACHSDQDKFGDHALSCRYEGDIIARHNTICESIYSFMKEGKMSVQREGTTATNNDRPGDIVAHNWTAGKSAFFDVSVTSPTCKSYIKYGAKQYGAASQRVDQKKKKYQDHNILFIPLVVETLGAWHPSAIPVLKNIAARNSESTFLDTRNSLSNMMKSLSFRLQRANAAMLSSRFLT
jgi:hypothetical protein